MKNPQSFITIALHHFERDPANQSTPPLTSMGAASSSEKASLRRAKNVAVVGLDGSGKSCLLARFFCSRKFESVDVTPPFYTQRVAHAISELARSKQSRGFVSKLATVILPTCGFQCIEMVETSGAPWRVWDMSGQGRYRHFWEEYCASADAVVFVHACDDVARLEAMKREFQAVVKSIDVGPRGGTPVPFLFVLAKSDLIAKAAGGGGDDGDEDGEGDDEEEEEEEEERAELGPEAQITPAQLTRVLELDMLDPHLHTSHVLMMSALSGDGIGDGFKWIAAMIEKALTMQ